MEEKDIFVPLPEELMNLQPGPSCKTRPIREAKAKGIGKLSEVMKTKHDEEIKMRLEDKRQRESKRVKIENDSDENYNDDSLELPALSNMINQETSPNKFNSYRVKINNLDYQKRQKAQKENQQVL